MTHILKDLSEAALIREAFYLCNKPETLNITKTQDWIFLFRGSLLAGITTFLWLDPFCSDIFYFWTRFSAQKTSLKLIWGSKVKSLSKALLLWPWGRHIWRLTSWIIDRKLHRGREDETPSWAATCVWSNARRTSTGSCSSRKAGVTPCGRWTDMET